MTPSNSCLVFIKNFEGCSLKAYLDPIGIPTIGYGSITYPDGRKVRMGDIITQEQADQYLKFEVNKKAVGVDTLTKPVAINQNQFDALVSFAYNCGLTNLSKSTLLKKVLANPSDVSIREQFLKWNKAAGVVLKGLQRRREAEADLYFSV
jgi:lysozyme